MASGLGLGFRTQTLSTTAPRVLVTTMHPGFEKVWACRVYLGLYLPTV